MSSDFDLNQAIAAWLKSFRKHRAFSHGTIREMELHLRDHIFDLQAQGLSNQQAFEKAVREFGEIKSMAQEEYQIQKIGNTSNSIINIAMLSNYLKIAYRNFWNQKFYALVNLFGLTMGFTIVFLIGLFVTDELSFDRFHSNKENLYRVVENQYYSGQPVFPVAVTPTALAPALAAEFPEIIKTSRVQTSNNQVFKVGEKQLLEGDGAKVDSEFFDMFSFEIINGSVAGFKENLNAVVLSKELADKYFTNQNPVGQSIIISDEEFEVVAVIEDAPKSSHLVYRYLTNFEKFLAKDPEQASSWGSNWLYTYALLENGANHEVVNEKIKDLIKTNNEGSVTDIYLQPMLDIYLGEVDFVVEVSRKGEMMYVKMFTIVAIFILILSCINFMNLATARAGKRAKEVGLRKTVGAIRGQLIWQFMSESTMLTLGSLILSFGFISLFLPVFNELANKEFAITTIINSSTGIYFLIGILIVTLFTGLVAGSYPALYLSGLNPITSLSKDKSKNSKGSLLRKFLVVFQFTISVILIIGTIVIYKQLTYIQNADLGFNKNNILYTFIDEARSDQFASQLRSQTDVLGVGGSDHHPGYALSSTSNVSWTGKNPDDQILIHTIGADEFYFSTMEMSMSQGREFNSTDSMAIIINETALKTMGLSDPIGQVVTAFGDEYKIVGVASDFNFKSIHTEIEPMVIYKLESPNRLYIRYADGNSEAIVETVGNVWKTMVPEREFDYYFLEEDFNEMYSAEERTSTLSTFFALFAILISCLGLFGLVAFATEQRTKEVGIRKVLGASVNNLFVLLTGDFTKLVAISLLFSIPIGWYAMYKWLDNFAYRVDLSLWIFIIAAIVALAITVITVSYQTVRAALGNPVNALRNE